MSFTTSYLSGLVGAFTPCIIVLMPILLYKFFNNKEDKKWFGFIEFIISFLFSYLLFGFFLSELFTSQVQNGVKVGIGLLFIVLGILAVFGKLNPINFPLIKNNIVFGFIFSLIISFNPCTIPFLSLIISLNNSVDILSNMFYFSLGLITPSIIFAFFGNSLIKFINNFGNKFNMINNLMHFVLILSGVYLIFSIDNLTRYDLFLISFFILFIFYILLRIFFILNSKRDLLNLGNILLLISLLGILFTALFHCNSYITLKESNPFVLILNDIDSNNLDININNSNYDFKDKNDSKNREISNSLNNYEYSCSGNIGECEICTKCINRFFLTTMIGFLGIFLINWNRLRAKRIIKIN